MPNERFRAKLPQNTYALNCCVEMNFNRTGRGNEEIASWICTTGRIQTIKVGKESFRICNEREPTIHWFG